MSNYSEKTRSYIKRFGHSGAARELIKDAAKDGELSKHLLQLGAAQEVRNAMGAGRKPSNSPGPISPPGPYPAPKPGEDIDLPADIARRWMDEYHLFGSDVTLAKATAKDLANSAREHDAHAKGHNATAAFERAVALRLEKTGKRVEQVFTDETLKTLKKSVS